MNDYQWIVFDSTGTLLETDPEPATVYHEIGQRYGSRRSVEQIRQDLKTAIRTHFFGDSSEEPTDEARELVRWKAIVADTLPDLAPSEADVAFETLWKQFSTARSWRLFDDVEATINRLRSKGYRIAVASNFDRRLRRVLDELDAVDLFDEILISSELGWSKPNPKFYDVAAHRLDAIGTGKRLMIGDTLEGDVHAARRAGWDARHLVRDQADSLRKLTADL